jgi:hypothetical protein
MSENETKVLSRRTVLLALLGISVGGLVVGPSWAEAEDDHRRRRRRRWWHRRRDGDDGRRRRRRRRDD